MSLKDALEYHTNQTHYLRKKVSYTDAGAVVSVGWVPDDAIVLGATVVVTEAFNSGTSDVVDLGFRGAGDGTADDTNEFATAVSVATVGAKAADEMATAGDLHFPKGAEIVYTHTASGTAATAGTAYVVVEFVVNNGE